MKNSAVWPLMLVVLLAIILVPPLFKERTHESAIKTEQATVIQHVHVPSTSGTTSGTWDTNGDFTFGETFSTEEVWGIVVKCKDHDNVFTLRGKDVYGAYKDGDLLTLDYVDVMNKKGYVLSQRTIRSYKTEK